MVNKMPFSMVWLPFVPPAGYYNVNVTLSTNNNARLVQFIAIGLIG